MKIGKRISLTKEEMEYMIHKRAKIIDSEAGRRLAGQQFEAAAGRLAECMFAEVVDGKGMSLLATRAFGKGRVSAYITLQVDDYKGADIVLMFQHDEADEEGDGADRGYPVVVDVTTGADHIDAKWDTITRTMLREGGKMVNWYDVDASKAGAMYSSPDEGKIKTIPIALILPPELVLRAGGEHAKNESDAREAMKEMAAITRMQMRDALEWTAIGLLKMETTSDALQRGHLLTVLKQISERPDDKRARAAEILYHSLKVVYAALEEMPVNESKYRERMKDFISRDMRRFLRIAA